MKNIVGLFLLSCLLTSCDYDTKITKTETSFHVDTVTSIGSNSKAVNTNKDDLNHNTSNKKNDNNDTSNFQIVNNDNKNSSVINESNNVVVYSYGYNNTNIITNRENNNQTPSIELIPTGKKIKIALSNNLTYDMKSVFPIEQSCSSNSDNYLEVDEALLPYIQQEKLKSGIIQNLSNNYRFSNRQALTVNLISPPLSQIKTSGLGDVTISCVSPLNFTWSDNATGDKKLKNIHSKFVKIEHNGVGNFQLYNTQIDNLTLNKNAIGDFKSKGHINTVNIDNTGIGNINIEQANNASIYNSGIGDITISSKVNVIKVNKSGIGNININDE